MKKIFALICLLFLTACSALTNPPASTDSAKNVPFLTYTRSGGFAGVNESWKIYNDGRVVAENGAEKQADPQAVQELLEQVGKTDLAGLSKITPIPGVCADCFNIELVFNDGGRETRLSVVPESQSADPAAVNVVDMVQKVIDSAQ